MTDAINSDPEIQYPRLTDTLIEAGGGKAAKTLFTDLMVGKWSLYAHGYKRAADELVDKIVGEAPDDVLILPVVFLYRHYVELTLKDLILRLVNLCDVQIEPKQITDHKLPPLWQLAKTHLHCVKEEMQDKEVVPALDKLIAELQELDPDSMHFRYAVNKDFAEMVLPRSVSMKHLKETMEKIRHGFSYIEAGIDMEWEARAFDAELRAEVESYY